MLDGSAIGTPRLPVSFAALALATAVLAFAALLTTASPSCSARDKRQNDLSNGIVAELQDLVTQVPTIGALHEIFAEDG